jgi:aryl-alcohol dehydrogenase-like predicted oxidoreductase
MEDYVRQGKVKFIGVSNFNRHHLDDLLSYAEIRPVISLGYRAGEPNRPERRPLDDIAKFY